MEKIGPDCQNIIWDYVEDLEMTQLHQDRMFCVLQEYKQKIQMKQVLLKSRYIGFGKVLCFLHVGKIERCCWFYKTTDPNWEPQLSPVVLFPIHEQILGP